MRDVLDAAIGRSTQAAYGQLYRSWLWQRSLNGPAPDRILAYPRDFCPKSQVECQLLLIGRYRLAGGEANTRDGSPFFVQAPSELWRESLHAFHWIRHFDSAGGEPIQDHVRQLVSHWLRNYGDWDETAWRPHVIARRLMTWLSFGRTLLGNADVLFRARVLLSMARQSRHLARTASRAPEGLPRLVAAIGLAQSGACLPDGEDRLNKGLHLLARELGEQVLPDGGHISRRPEAVLEITSDLLALLDAMVQRDLLIPVTIRRALDRLSAMIRFLQHPDGRLAVFHGGTEAAPGWAETLLLHCPTKPKPALQALQSGYQRVTCGSSVLIADAGPLPPPAHATLAHAGPLAFEFSSGQQRLIVNCGASQTKGTEWEDAMRATAAHATVTIADSSAGRLRRDTPWQAAATGIAMVEGPLHVDCRRRENEDGVLLEMSHDGYAPTRGLVHERSIFLSHDGLDLRGEDRITPVAGEPGAHPVAARFHLHPSVRIMRAGQGIILTTQGGATWRFSSDLPVSIEDSVYLASGDQVRKTSQLVLAANSSQSPCVIKWALRRATADGPETPVNFPAPPI